MKFKQTPLGLEISSKYTSNLGTEREVIMTLQTDPKLLNVAATSDLNLEGIRKLRRLLDVAESIIRDGEMPI